MAHFISLIFVSLHWPSRATSLPHLVVYSQPPQLSEHSLKGPSLLPAPCSFISLPSVSSSRFSKLITSLSSLTCIAIPRKPLIRIPTKNRTGFEEVYLWFGLWWMDEYGRQQEGRKERREKSAKGFLYFLLFWDFGNS